jgi:SAM-dependent methyltransferase
MSTAFVGSVPDYYDRLLGPVLFEPYARDLVARLPAGTRSVVEIAAGTGRVTRHLVATLPPDGTLVATDLNEAMLVEARARITDPRVRWQVADAQALPFSDGAFEVAACQFGLMFMPDQARAFAELRRVARVALFSTWNTSAHNGATLVAHEVAIAASPDARFYEVPFSLPDPDAVIALARAAGFSDARAETIEHTAIADSAADLAAGLVRGNPLVAQLAAAGIELAAFEAKLAAALAARFGDRPCCSPLSAHLFVAR